MAKDKHGIPSKTNVARLLDKADIPYELIPYEVDEENLAAGHVAEQLGEDIRQVLKTLCCKGSILAVIRRVRMPQVISCV